MTAHPKPRSAAPPEQPFFISPTRPSKCVPAGRSSSPTHIDLSRASLSFSR
ncbi:Hypothetical protein A7982_06312 [Minicystis rosea]|nr:Hypothetical protein A7982_06312 [Minicystis rosea]